ncbi:MAG: ElyC/SanA/YdcF family protein [Candidatus Omnitrophota bacterium]|nr:ElyC/SanA/YdcF family protein [Candidatus Omnitrophota bacterium]
MLKGENIICISSIDWDFIWQGHQEIMSVLAENGNRVLFIENTGVRAPGMRDISRIKSRIRNWIRGVKGIRKEAENLYIFSPIVLPFPYSRIARWVNYFLISSVLDKWMKVMDFVDPVVWTFLPTPLSLDITDNLLKKIMVYYCIDNFAATSSSARNIRKSEEKLLKKADMVFVTSKELYNHSARYNKQVYNFPFAVNFKKFEGLRDKNTTMPEELKNIKHPVIGYVGGVHKCIDLPLIKKTANIYSDYSFVFIGPVQTDISLILGLKNVYFLGKKKHEEVPLFIKYFDACIIPYLINDYTINVYPTKLNEYLAMGKPVISTDLPEIRLFCAENKGAIYTAGDEKEFISCVDKALREEEPVLKNKRIDIARQNNWEKRIEKMSDLIEREIKRKRIDAEAMWKENLVNFYRIARRKLFCAVAVCFLIYVVLFKTPLLWFLADPLRIADAPRKADAILVFGGGVGETGSPGKSTIERARYAVKLYKGGYADKIIFSSGYIYNYNDAENMKLFAVSMGIPERNIILEQKANSAYENVIFSKEILDRNNWRSVLLVSSPYNMRRAALVFNKWDRGLDVIYTPVEYSQFYDNKEGARMEQIKAITHEYLGIAYYWFKGYI